MNIEKQKSKKIRNKLIVRFALAFSAFVLFVYLYFPMRLEENLLRAQIEKDNAIANMTAYNLGPAIVFNDMEEMELNFQNSRQNSDLLFIVVEDINGNLIGTFNFSLASASDFHEINRDRIQTGKERVYKLCSPIFSSGVPVGSLYMGFSLEKVFEQTRRSRLNIGLIALAIFIIGFIIISTVTSMLIHPLDHLVETTRKIQSGDLTQRVEQNSKDEFGKLASSFNNMLNTIEKNTRRLSREILQRKDTEKKLQDYAHRLEGLRMVYTGILGAQSATDIASAAINRLKTELVPCDRSNVMLFNYKSNLATILAMNNSGKKNFFDITTEPLDKFKTSEILIKNDFYIVDDISKLKHPSQSDLQLLQNGIRSYISLPLLVLGKLIGSLNLGSEQPGYFQAEHVEITREVADQLALAIHQANLYEEIEHNAESLKKSLKEKEVLLREIHHRVKNNLQIISSLLYLQSKNIENNDTRMLFDESRNRVRAMALIHENLYKFDNLAYINLREYMQSLVNNIRNTYATEGKPVIVKTDIEDLALDLDKAIPCGLIVNELMSNAFKYAFPDDIPLNNSGNTIRIRISGFNDDSVEILVQDNGVGLPHGFKIEESDSLGMRLIQNLCNQIGGQMKVKNKNGTSFIMHFKM